LGKISGEKRRNGRGVDPWEGKGASRETKRESQNTGGFPEEEVWWRKKSRIRKKKEKENQRGLETLVGRKKTV